ncbi:hypothetical protein LQ772_11580 [Frateuria edaphi]|uniref:hypothetical protein n=1 Tax=Frateuria edaphi TaxID=2898793 RepID=UPI001E3C7D67|nr:hypothetical protein [Frateuria edaphi]UGB44629.1 hypothetical protein LQ772_11580 [Frateuria edaphi]
MSTSDATVAAALMDAFARRTGLDGDTLPVRYLWTDAFATCNFLGLAQAGGGARYDALAQRTITQVHEVLAHFRADDFRSGWLRGPHGCADDDHPTRPGLRIGKPLPERAAGEPFDERLEWERDGQYFHYLTRWMHALDRCVRLRHAAHSNRWARELADTAHRAFAASGGGMYWKMSTDLARPLVASMGQHDPLDGLLTARALQATAQVLGDASGPSLDAAIAGYTGMLHGSQLATADPLGLGGLLVDALRLDRLSQAGNTGDRALLDHLLAAALASLPHGQRSLHGAANTRLGFRELGLAIGLAALERLIAAPMSRTNQARLDAFRSYLPLRRAIIDYWLAPDHRAAASWTAHRDINEVMLATSLMPDGWLGDQAPSG